jgi:predicted Rossmann fold flavoprotein
VSNTPTLPARCDVAIVGAGAAGLMTALHARRGTPPPRVVLLDGAAKPGAKILVSGGSRCNVTNTVVTEQDFWGGRRTIVRRVLQKFTPADAIRFFEARGVTLREEADGKLFPVSNRSRDVLDALLAAARDAGVELHSATRVTAVTRSPHSFEIETTRGRLVADRVVLATGGRSLPKTGSDGAGYAFARLLGHAVVETTPALAPLLLDESSPFAINRDLSGVSHDVSVDVWIDGARAITLTGALLWTHFGVSGPVVLNASRHWARALLEGHAARVVVNFYEGRDFSDVERSWIEASARRSSTTVRSMLAAAVPDAVGRALLRIVEVEEDRLLATLSREDRRKIVHAAVAWPLPIVDTRGYTYAEVTAGGVALTEIDPSTMESRVCPGLYLVGEILDVDGRIGGFNFQWSWASAAVAGAALAAGPWTAPGERR